MVEVGAPSVKSSATWLLSSDLTFANGPDANMPVELLVIMLALRVTGDEALALNISLSTPLLYSVIFDASGRSATLSTSKTVVASKRTLS